MKRLFPLLLAALAFVPALHAQDQIKIETKFIKIETKFIETSIAVTPPVDIATLNRMKDVDLLAAPRVTTKPGQKATVEITHEQALPAGDVAAPEAAETGTSLEATAVLRDDVPSPIACGRRSATWCKRRCSRVEPWKPSRATFTRRAWRKTANRSGCDSLRTRRAGRCWCR